MCWLEEHHVEGVFTNARSIHLVCWARACLPNGQIVCSLWKEGHAPLFMARNIKVRLLQSMIEIILRLTEYIQYRFLTADEVVSWHIAEVQYLFHICSLDPLDLETWMLALISMWTPHHQKIWTYSNRTCWFLCSQGQSPLKVINVKDIQACVPMVPHRL
jgi:hypothetical protein